MTCTQIDARVDALPFSEWQAADRKAADEHARDCDRCRATLAEAEHLASALARLADPVEPAALAAATMARIARLDDPRAVLADGRKRRDAARADRRASLLALVGQIAGIAALGAIAVASGSVPDVASPRLGAGTEGPLSLPQTVPAALMLAAGLTLYLAGFFAPMRRSSR